MRKTTADERHLDDERCGVCGHYESDHGLQTMGFRCGVWGCRCRGRGDLSDGPRVHSRNLGQADG